jgi:signal transduction histidine kinase
MSDEATLAQLRQSLGLLQVAFDAAAEAMVIVEPGGEVRWGNQAAADLWTNGMAILLVGRRLEQLLQSLTSSSGVPMAIEAAEHPLQRFSYGDGQGTYGMGEQLLQLEWRRIPQPGDGYLLLLARDLAPQELALQQQRRFLNQLAHELNTPLAIVSGSLKQLGKKALDLGKGSRQRLQQAQQETTRLVRLLRNLLVLSDLETGRRQLQLQPVELQGWLQQWRDQQELPEDVQLIVLPAVGELAPVGLDVEAFAEVLAQLLDNSLRYSETPAHIQLQLQQTNSEAVLRWQDQGLGISAQPRDQVFQRFVRLEEHRHRSQADGAGLGLALCVALMQAMGGSIALEPVAEASTGASFLLQWPSALRQITLQHGFHVIK